VVVVEQLDAFLLECGGDLEDAPRDGGPQVRAGPSLLVEPGHGDVPAAELLVEGDDAVHVLEECVQRGMARDRDEAHLVEPGLDGLRRVPVVAGELDALVAHVLDRLERAVEVLLEDVPHRV